MNLMTGRAMGEDHGGEQGQGNEDAQGDGQQQAAPLRAQGLVGDAVYRDELGGVRVLGSIVPASFLVCIHGQFPLMGLRENGAGAQYRLLHPSHSTLVGHMA